MGKNIVDRLDGFLLRDSIIFEVKLFADRNVISLIHYITDLNKVASTS